MKRLESAKTRIDVANGYRQALALAMATDTIQAAAQCALVHRVLLVSTDETVARHVSAPGLRLLEHEPAGGLNCALRYGLEHAARAYPNQGVAILPADLPAMTSTDLQLALELAGTGQRSVVSDVDGVGTVLLTQPPGDHVCPRFGGPSFARHLADGAVAIVDRRLRAMQRDVDTLLDLNDARSAGLGSRTLSCLRSPRSNRPHIVVPLGSENLS